MAANPKFHSVKLGTNTIGNENFPLNKVKTYMTTEPVKTILGPDTLDETQNINADLLQIISKGINNIVDQLKLRLGNNFTESNKNAGIIKKKLDDLKGEIDNEIANINPDDNSISFNDQAHNYAPIIGNNYLSGLQKTDGTNITVADINVTGDFTNLNDTHNNVIAEQNTFYDTLEVDYDRFTIENRLKNCQNLEFLYLKKHDEIMKIFSFTLNLFDKYKYAIKVILFLLKHLVYKDKAEDDDEDDDKENKIKLPLTIIPNIKKLLEDQKQVQGVINKMKEVIVTPHSSDANSPEAKLQKLQNPNDKPSEQQINSKIPDIP